MGAARRSHPVATPGGTDHRSLLVQPKAAKALPGPPQTRLSPLPLPPPPPPAANPRVTVPPAGVVPLSDVSFTPAKDTGIDRS